MQYTEEEILDDMIDTTGFGHWEKMVEEEREALMDYFASESIQEAHKQSRLLELYKSTSRELNRVARHVAQTDDMVRGKMRGTIKAKRLYTRWETYNELWVQYLLIKKWFLEQWELEVNEKKENKTPRTSQTKYVSDVDIILDF